jgi:prolyl oligopeptidase
MKYPTLKLIPVSETYFGQTIEDKYRILENSKDSSVQRWIVEEKAIYDSVINKMPYKDSLKNQLEEIIYSSNAVGGFPRASKNKIFFNRTYLKEKIQKIFYKDSLTGRETEIFSTKDINKDDKTYSIDFFEPSYDGKYLTLGLSPNGSELAVIRIINVETKSFLPETIERATYGTPFWISGKNAFFYNQLRETAPSDKNKSEDSKVKLHWLNTNPENDIEIFSRTLNADLALEKIDFPVIYTFPRSKKAMALVYRGTNQYFSLFSCDLDPLLDKSKVSKAKWTKICSPSDKVKNFALNGQDLYLTRFQNNPNGVLEKYDIGKGLTDGKIIIEGKDEVLDDIILTNNFLYLSKLRSGFSLIEKIELSTGNISETQLPFKGFAKITSPFRTSHFYSNSDNLLYAIG